MKTTIDITREEGIKVINDRVSRYKLEKLTDNELCNLIGKIGYGDDKNLPYYGFNFKIKENDCKNKKGK
jgi:hypothetical protein